MNHKERELALRMLDLIEDLLIENRIFRGAIIGAGLTAIQSLLDLALKPDSPWREVESQKLARIRAQIVAGDVEGPEKLEDILKDFPPKGSA